MSKLDGNERWKSKMLLTGHAERYERRNEAAKGNITSEERTMLRDFILLPYMEKMVQKSIADVGNSNNVLKRLYLMAGQKILDEISNDIYRIRRELNKRNIKVVAEEQEDFVIYHQYICRGYEDRFGITRDVMRSEISVQLAKYMSALSTLLRGSPIG